MCAKGVDALPWLDNSVRPQSVSLVPQSGLSMVDNVIPPPPWFIESFQPRVWLRTHTQCMWSNLMRLVPMDMDTFTPTSTQPRSTMFPSAGAEHWRTPTTRCISNFVLSPTFWMRQQLRTVSSYGLMIMNRQLIQSIRVTARILPVEYCCPIFLGSVTAYRY